MTTLVDTHMHFHECFRLSEVLDAVWRRVDGARALRPVGTAAGCLVSTEITPRDPLYLVKRRTRHLPRSWRVEVVGDPEALVIERDGARVFAVVPGRQFVTTEGLEVLALATSTYFGPGLSLRAAVGAILDEGGIPVVPWGFGKWTFGRARTLERFLREDEAAQKIFLGDNGCRPHGLGTPRQLARAPERGLRVLAGSDPMPFRDHESRAASYGTLLSEAMDWQQPSAWLREHLRLLRSSPQIFGCGCSLRLFLRDQLRIRRRGKLAA